LELAAEEVLFPLQLRALEIRHALRVDEDPDVLSRDDEVGRPRRIREVHSVLHAAAAAGDDAQPERGLGAALLLLQHPDPPHGAVRDDQRVFLRGHHRDRVSESFEGPPSTKVFRGQCRVGSACWPVRFNVQFLTTKDIYNNVIVSHSAPRKWEAFPWSRRVYSRSKWPSRSTNTVSSPTSMRTRSRKA